MSTADLGKLSAAEWEELQGIADRFAEARGRAADADLDGFVPPPGHRLRLLCLRELILIALETRSEHAESIRVADFVQRYPELEASPGILVQLVSEELRIRHARRESLSQAEYAAAFPALAVELEQIFRDLPAQQTEAPSSTNSTWSDEPARPIDPGATTTDFHPRAGVTGLPSVRERVGEFELIRVLGEGSFGKVYLARQLSLDRLVALKITSDTSTEARTLASLEHDHIVHVFSERVDHKRRLRLLCMQYVAGPTLERVIAELKRMPREAWSGRAIIESIDRLSEQTTTFHPAALRDRELLVHADFVQAVSWLGARLAEALAHAHSQGVLHRDIKPANVLLSPYGRPLLADFNVSLNTQKVSAARAGLGGTLAYMAPEHLDACNPSGETLPEQVAERADVYSLGVTLYEVLAGERPFRDGPRKDGKTVEVFHAMTEARRAGAPSLHQRFPDVPAVLDDVLKRCLHPSPASRYESAAALARALEGARELRRIERELPSVRAVTAAILRRPFRALIVLALLPHLASSFVNLTYNWLEIVSKFQSEPLRVAFNQVALCYNLFLYPLCTWLMIRQVLPVYRTWRAMQEGQLLERERVEEARRRMLTWAGWAVGLSALGWLPGGVLFPVGIEALAGGLPMDAFIHFPISFTLSGLIALTYAYFGVQFVVLRFLYPRLWIDPQDVPGTIQKELGRRPRLGFFQFLAGVIPLCGAVLLVVVGPESTSDLAFRLLAAALIVLGMVGFGIAQGVNRLLERTLEVLARR